MYDTLTKWQPYGLLQRDRFTPSNRILSNPSYPVLFAFVELAHFELECVAVGVASIGEGARAGVGLLNNVASDR